ncbi:MAG TPA: SDR family oxidoreductase [Gemmatimonadales bacterium]
MTARVLVTGAAGYLGSRLIEALATEERARWEALVATDLRAPPDHLRLPGITWVRHDVRNPGLAELLQEHGITAVIHLASIVTPGKGSTRELEYSVDVLGTRNVVHACLGAGVRRLVVTSSGAAYGYHADNPARLTEDHPLRGNVEFAYSDHKRQVEGILAACRAAHPELEQVVLRVGTILGERTDNQITALFRRRRPLAIRGAASPFVFVWDRDVVGCLVRGMADGPPGVYNVAGDGTMAMDDIAVAMGTRARHLPAGLLRAALAVLKPLGLSRYGPEQVGFLQYRPVLDNTRLKTVFGYVPRKTSREAFEVWRESNVVSRKSYEVRLPTFSS